MTEETSGPLARENEVFQSLLPTMRKDEGKYAVIFQDVLVGTFDGYEDALSAGYHKAGLSPFLVRKITALPFVANYTRDLRLITA